MSLTAAQLPGHPVWSALQELGPILDQAAAKDGIEAETAEGVARLKAVLTFTGKRIAGADPFLVPPAHLNIIDTALRTIANQVQQYVSTGDVAFIQTAGQQADNVLVNLTYIPVQFTTEDFVAAKEAAEEYRIAFQKLFTDIRKLGQEVSTATAALQPQVSDLTSKVESLRQQVIATSTMHQAQFDAAQSARQEEWKNSQTTQQSRLEALLNEYKAALNSQAHTIATTLAKAQDDFDAAQTARATEWVTAKKQYDDQLNSAIDNFAKQLRAKDEEFDTLKEEIVARHDKYLGEMKTSFADSAKGLLDEITKRKEEADILLGIIADRSVTSGHQKEADEARSAKRLWQFVTVSSMLGLIGAAIYTFLPQLTGTFTWEGFAGRVFISLTFGVLAAYAGSQADKYQKIERYSRNLALELQAIGPFIAPLPQAQQDEFRLKVGERSFGQQAASSASVNDTSPTSVADLIKSSKDLAKFTAEVIKATSEAAKKD